MQIKKNRAINVCQLFSRSSRLKREGGIRCERWPRGTSRTRRKEASHCGFTFYTCNDASINFRKTPQNISKKNWIRLSPAGFGVSYRLVNKVMSITSKHFGRVVQCDSIYVNGMFFFIIVNVNYSRIFNDTIKQKRHPRLWKLARRNWIYKCGDKLSVENYQSWGAIFFLKLLTRVILYRDKST